MPTWVRTYRVAFALLAFAAIVYQLSTGVARGDFDVGNFFSFFTIESNIVAALVLLVTAIIGGTPSPRRDLIRGAAVTYMATTGVVYGLLLSGYTDALQTPVPWVNDVLHRLMPLVLVTDWLLAPPGPGLIYRRALVWMIFPLAYLAYSLVRGTLVGWYPYPFLDPGKVGGYAGVALYAIGIALGFFLFVWLIVALGQRVRLRVEAA